MELTYKLNKKESAHLRRFIAQYPDRAQKALGKAGALIAAHLKEHKLSGQVLNIRSQTLRDSVNFGYMRDSSGIYGVQIGTNVFYGRIHENKGRPWLGPGFNEKKRKAWRIISKEIGNGLH